MMMMVRCKSAQPSLSIRATEKLGGYVPTCIFTCTSKQGCSLWGKRGVTLMTKLQVDITCSRRCTSKNVRR